MENHPIPQDITGFQFKLIGKMTVKQFAYIGIGVVLAWFFFFILPLPLLIRLPLAILFLSVGGSLAFVPVDGRPMDTMFINLIRAMFAPTQYVYKKTGIEEASPNSIPTTTYVPPQSTANINNAPQTAFQVNSQPEAMPIQPQQPPAQTYPNASQIQAPIQPLAQTPTTSPASFAPPLQQAQAQGYGPVIELQSQAPLQSGNLDDLEKVKNEEEEEKIAENERKLEEEVTHLKEELAEVKSTESTQANTPIGQAAHQKAEELERLLIETSRQKEALEKELLMLKAKLEGESTQKYDPSTLTPPPQTQRVRKVPPGMEKSVGVPQMPQDPNLITGIVKDPRGNPLANILVEVKDLEDNPVRAFKTNGLGQFASATSLSNGTYIVSFEDPKGENKFDTVQIEATGLPMMPLEIISVDPREELRRELFK